MTDRYENIRKALAMGPTPGPWQLSIETPTIIKQDLSSIGLSMGGVLIGSACGHESSGFYPTREQSIANARLIAACDPDTIRALLEERDDLAKDAARYRWLRDTLMNSVGGGVEVNEDALVYQKSEPGEEVRVYWYPDTPVGFYEVHGSTIDAAIDAARSTPATEKVE